jgi:serine/threonine protein kinase
MSADSALQRGDVLRSRYEVQQILHSAHDKRVYLARDRVLHCQVAIDVFANNSLMPTGLTVSAWETSVLGELGDHRNIATVLDHWEDGNTAVMVSRYLSGGTLQDLIARRQDPGENMPLDTILRISTEIASGLEHIHGRRILYRDLQPHNVLFDDWGVVRLVDFDTAVSLDDHEMSDLSGRAVIEYMAPELVNGGNADERADLYSLGATIYAMCAGQPPFAGSRGEILDARRSGPPTLGRDDLPEALRSLIFGLLAHDSEQRPASAADVVEHLKGIRAAETAPGQGDSLSLPGPDPAEIRSSVGSKAAEYDIGDVIDERFEVLALIAQGGFSKVYRVRDEVEDQERALKLFDNAAGYAAVFREISALRKIHHPNVVEVFWANKTRDGDWYLITEFIDGESLDEFVTGTKRLGHLDAVDIAIDVLDALVAFHPDAERINELDAKNSGSSLSEAELHEWMDLKDRSLVHRDIKPLNVMLTRTGAKLLDFNIASRVGDPVRTQSGTPPYQPPDADLTRWDVSPDLFAVGVVLYQLLCDGQHPYPNAMPMYGEPVIEPRSIRPGLSPDLAEFLIKACASANDYRFSTAAEMQAILQEIRDNLDVQSIQRE